MQGLTKYIIYAFVIFHWPKLLFSFVYYQVVENYTNSYEFSKIFYSHSIFLSDIFFCLWAKVSWHLALETITKNSISNRKCWLFRSVFFNLVWFTAPLRTKNIWWHLNAPKMTILDTLNSKVQIKDIYYIKLYVNSLFGGTAGTSSQHPCCAAAPWLGNTGLDRIDIQRHTKISKKGNFSLSFIEAQKQSIQTLSQLVFQFLLLSLSVCDMCDIFTHYETAKHSKKEKKYCL